jgi:hypothetical protein
VVHDDLNGGELLGQFASVVTVAEPEDEHTGAILEVALQIVRGVSISGDNVNCGRRCCRCRRLGTRALWAAGRATVFSKTKT